MKRKKETNITKITKINNELEQDADKTELEKAIAEAELAYLENERLSAAFATGDVEFMKSFFSNGVGRNSGGRNRSVKEVETSDPTGWSALSWSCWFGHKELVKFFLSCPGTDVNHKSLENGETAVMVAAQQGHTEIIDILINAGARNGRDHKGKTALLHACENGFAETVEYLLLNGSKIDERDDVGRDILYYTSDISIIRKLVEMIKKK